MVVVEVFFVVGFGGCALHLLPRRGVVWVWLLACVLVFVWGQLWLVLLLVLELLVFSLALLLPLFLVL